MRGSPRDRLAAKRAPAAWVLAVVRVDRPRTGAGRGEGAPVRRVRVIPKALDHGRQPLRAVAGPSPRSETG